MRVLIAPDKFRESLSATQVCEAVKAGILAAFPKAILELVPLADGGEGMLEILRAYTRAKILRAATVDALGRPTRASYAIDSTNKTGFVELAEASGLAKLEVKDHNPMLTNTFGTGQLIKKALSHGIKTLILGLGGSATNDGGVGMAAALGYRFLDKNDREIIPRGETLRFINRIDFRKVEPKLRDLQVLVASDVKNPLLGPLGATHVYGPQKGAAKKDLKPLEDGLKNLVNVCHKEFGRDVHELPGAGAAGGVGAGAMWFLNAKIKDGMSLIAEMANLDEKIILADLVITGEGKLDEQTLQGKVVKGVADKCQKHKTPVIAICGTLLLSPEQIKGAGLAYASSIIPYPASLKEAQENAALWVQQLSFNLVRFFFDRSLA